MKDRKGIPDKERFLRRKDAKGKLLCRMCGEPTFGRHSFSAFRLKNFLHVPKAGTFSCYALGKCH
jgi:hypothetical protein